MSEQEAKVLTVEYESWVEQTAYVQALANLRTGNAGMLMDGLAAWMQELEAMLLDGPVVVATKVPWPDGVKLINCKVVGKTYHPDGQLASVSITWEREEPFDE